MKTSFFHFVLCLIVGCLAYITSSQTVAAPLPSAEDVCGVISSKHDNRNYARTFAQNLDVGEPRTVRMIYFLPNDRPYRADVVQRMKEEIRNIQTFYAEQMKAHGHGDKTFKIETNAQGELVVNRVDGQHPDIYYLDDMEMTVYDEIDQVFDVRNNIYFIVVDNSINAISNGGVTFVRGIGGRIGKNGGDLLIHGEFEFSTAAHELGHAFGLNHDFRHPNGFYIMSYGPGLNRAIPTGGQERHQLSVCNADFLAVHPYFNPDIPTEEGQKPNIELTSPSSYPAGSQSVSIQLEISDLEGIHQVILFVEGIGGPLTSSGYPEVKACRRMAGEKESVVEFEYDGDMPSTLFTSLFHPSKHSIRIAAVDINGDVRYHYFTLSKIQPPQPPIIPKMLVKISGDNQQGTAGATLTHPLEVEVRDLSGNPLSGATVKFTVTSGIGKLNERFTVENVITDDVGQAKSLLTLGTNLGNYTVEASVSEGESVTFHAISVKTDISLINSDYRTWGLPDGARIRLGKGGVGTSDKSVAFSPDGQYLAVSSRIGIWLYDVITYQELALLSHPWSLNSVAFSPDGKSLLAGSSASTAGWKLNLWNVATREKIATFGKGESVAFSSDGVTVASVWRGGEIKLWNVETGQGFATLNHRDLAEIITVNSIAFSPDGTMLASGGDGGAVKLWAVATEENIATIRHKSRIHSVVFSPDGRVLASSAYDRTVKLWDVAMDTEITTIQNSANCVTFSPDGKTLAWAAGTRIKLWDIATHTIIATFVDDYAFGVTSIAFSPDGKTLISASWGDGFVKVWDIETGNAVDLGHTLLEHISFSPDSTILASGARDGTVKLWDVITGQNIGNLSGKPRSWVRLMIFSPDGRMLASRSTGESFTKLWDVTTQTMTGTIKNAGVTSWTFSPDGKILVSGASDYKIKLWDVVTGQNVAMLQGHVGRVYSVAFSPDGKIIASSSEKAIKLWDVVREQSIATFIHEKPVYSVKLAFSPDGKILASGTFKDVKLWDVETRTLITTIDDVNSLTFSPNGKIMVLKNNETPSISLWSTATQAPIATIQGIPSTPIFSPDWSTLASNHRNTIILADMGILNGMFTAAPAGIHLTPPPMTALLPNYPNPFNPETWIPFRLAEDADVMLTIYDVSGKEVRSLDIGHTKTGVHESRNKAIYWDGRNDLGENVASGVYFYHLKAGEYSATKRMVILK